MIEDLAAAFLLQLRGHEPRFPEATLHVVEWFARLHARRQNGFGKCPLSWSDIAAWCAFEGIEPQPWELRAILRLDDVYVRYEPPKAEDGATLVAATPENMKTMIRSLASKPAPGTVKAKR